MAQTTFRVNTSFSGIRETLANTGRKSHCVVMPTLENKLPGVDGPDRGRRGSDEPRRPLLAAADPLATLQAQGAAVQCVDDAG